MRPPLAALFVVGGATRACRIVAARAGWMSTLLDTNHYRLLGVPLFEHNTETPHPDEPNGGRSLSGIATGAGGGLQ